MLHTSEGCFQSRRARSIRQLAARQRGHCEVSAVRTVATLQTCATPPDDLLLTACATPPGDLSLTAAPHLQLTVADKPVPHLRLTFAERDCIQLWRQYIGALYSYPGTTFSLRWCLIFRNVGTLGLAGIDTHAKLGLIIDSAIFNNAVSNHEGDISGGGLTIVDGSVRLCMLLWLKLLIWTSLLTCPPLLARQTACPSTGTVMKDLWVAVAWQLAVMVTPCF